jgi:hypothetical protein
MSAEFLIGAWLAVGLVVLVLARIQHARQVSPESDLQRAVYDELYPQRKTARVQLLNKFVVPMLAGIAMVLLWPVAVVLMIRGAKS